MMPAMKLGLIADVRGSLEPLRTALAILAEEGCDEVACLGSTVEGGPDDDAVLEALRAANAVVLPSPHDVRPELAGLPAERELAGLVLAHATPEPLAPDEVLWLTQWWAPSALRARALAEAGVRRASGDLYAPFVLLAPDGLPPRRRLLLDAETLAVPAGAFLACPGSVALEPSARRSPSVLTWDGARGELAAVHFDSRGRRAPRSPKLRLLVYGLDFDAHRPDEADLEGVDLQVRGSADDIVADVARELPDLVLCDYRLEGKLSGLEAVLALRGGREQLPVPLLSITGNPSDAEGMKAAGAAWGLPHAWLKDSLTRLLREVTGRVAST